MKKKRNPKPETCLGLGVVKKRKKKKEKTSAQDTSRALVVGVWGCGGVVVLPVLLLELVVLVVLLLEMELVVLLTMVVVVDLVTLLYM